MKKKRNFKEKVENYFNNFSPTYDYTMKTRPNLILNRLHALLKEIKLPENPICLDLACGTGISTVELASICYGKPTIYGVDISEKMIDEANKIAKQNERSDIIYQRMDAEKLDFPDSTFDFVLCNMSFNFFPNKHKALSEVHRVLKRGGQFAFNYGAGQGNTEWLKVSQEIAEKHPDLPDFLKTVSEIKSSYISLEDSIELFSDAELTLMEIYGKHSIDWVDPSSFLGDQSTHWSIYQQVIPLSLVDSIRTEFIEIGTKLSEAGKGFKNTVYIIFAWGKKN